VTTAVACAATGALTGSWALAAGVAAGGFLIDVDHAVDYVLFDHQRDLRPNAFLRYYMEGRVRRTVLVLHSYELFVVLAALTWWLASPALVGYLMGAVMHLTLDLRFNGELTPRSIVAFYSFGYRLAHRFDAQALLGFEEPRALPAGFWATFFEDLRPGEARPVGAAEAEPIDRV
jgi:hypothetical protein